MANTDRVTGFKPVRHISGAPWNGQTVKMYKSAGTTVTNDMFPGDLVIMSGTGDADGVPGCTVATAGDGNKVCGVVVSIVPLYDHLERIWLDGADAGYVNVCTDPTVVLEAQSDASLTYTDIGQNANMVQTQAGSRTTGASGQELDATVATTSTHQLKIIGFAQRADNTLGSADVKVLCLINNHQFGNTVSGV